VCAALQRQGGVPGSAAGRPESDGGQTAGGAEGGGGARAGGAEGAAGEGWILLTVSDEAS